MTAASRAKHALCVLSCALAVLCIGSVAAAQSKRPARPRKAPVALVTKITLEAPSSLVLGREGAAEVKVRAPEGVRFRLHTSAGELGEPVPTGPGQYRALFKPPAQRFPQVALIAAISEDGSLFAKHRIELQGTAAVQVVSEPHVQVRVRIADATYGPIAADGNGRATVEITVPPGYPEVTSIATDSLGNQKEQPLPLGVPPLTRLLAVCPESGQAVVVLALDARGRPDPAAELEVTASRATVARTAAREAGTYRVELGVPDDVAAGETARVSVGLRGVPDARAECALKIPLELPNALALELSASSMSAAKPEVVRVRAVLRYAGKRDPAAVPILLVAEIGALAQTAARTSSGIETTWTIPREFGGRTEALLSARAGPLTAQARVELRPGPIASVRAEPEDDVLLADGRASTVVTVVVTDAHDNPADGAQLEAAGAGTLGPFRRVGVGRYEVEYRAPRQQWADVDRVTVRERFTGLSAHASVTLRGVRGPIVLGVRGGYTSNFGRVAGPLAGVLAGYRLPFAQQAFTVGFDVAYHHGSDAQRSADAREIVDVSVNAVPLLARAAYSVHAGGLDLALIAGAGVVLAQTELASPTTNSVRTSTSSFAWSAALRGSFELGPGGALLELGYLHSAVDTDAVSGNLGGAQLTAGYAVDLEP